MKLFESIVVQKKLKLDPAIYRDIKKTALKLPEIDEAGVEWSEENYPNGYTSYSSLSRLHEQFTVFDRLKSALDREVKIYAKQLGLRFDRGELALSSLWVNVMPKNCYHAFHIHPNSVVSGTFYVSVPKGKAPLRIEDPRAALFMACPHRKAQHDFHPKAGEIILFESYMRHEVPPHRTDETRVSVSFNYDWMQN